MKQYANLSGESGVRAFETGEDHIAVRFIGRSTVYRYSYKSCGPAAVERMKALAAAGRGLATFIAQNDPRYERRV